MDREPSAAQHTTTQWHTDGKDGRGMQKKGKRKKQGAERGKQALAAFYFLFCIHKGRLINVIVFGQQQHSEAQHSLLY